MCLTVLDNKVYCVNVANINIGWRTGPTKGKISIEHNGNQNITLNLAWRNTQMGYTY